MWRWRRIVALAILAVLCAAATPPQDPPSEVARSEPVEAPPVDPPPPVKQRYRVLILGDSMAATDFGSALESALDQHRKIRCARRGKSATGLARPDYFDWMREARKQVKRSSPDLIVVIIGGNDGQDLLTPKGQKRRRVLWNGASWKDAYRERVARFLGLLTEKDRRVLWLELPLMDHRSLEEKLALIRSVQKEAVEQVEGATWLSTRSFFLDPDGRLVRRTNVKGFKKTQRLRQRDGIHFTVAGARFFAERVAPEVIAALGL